MEKKNILKRKKSNNISFVLCNYLKYFKENSLI